MIYHARNEINNENYTKLISQLKDVLTIKNGRLTLFLIIKIDRKEKFLTMTLTLYGSLISADLQSAKTESSNDTNNK